MTDDRERLVAEIDPVLKERARVDPRPIREVVESALQREFMTGESAAVERRIDEKRQRIQQLEAERNEREREIAKEREELERLRQTLEAHQDQREELREEALSVLGDIAPAQLTPENPAVENWAERLDKTPAEVVDFVEANR